MAHAPAILVADDEPLLCDLIARLLSEAGYAVQTARDGDEAIAWMEGVRFDIAIIDVIMPRRDGIETIIEIRRRWPACKVLALSGGGRIRSGEFLELADRFGAHATLQKPLSAKDLMAALHRLMLQGANESRQAG